MNQFKKHLYLGIVCNSFSFICSAAAAEQFQKEDFETVVKRGYYDFLDRVGKEKALELGLITEPVNAEVQEKILILNSAIDQMIQHVNNLGSFSCHKGSAEASRILGVMKEYYKNEVCKELDSQVTMEKEEVVKEDKIIYEAMMPQIDEMISGIDIVLARTRTGSHTPVLQKYNKANNALIYFLKELLKKKMEKYKGLRGTAHPNWEEYIGAELRKKKEAEARKRSEEERRAAQDPFYDKLKSYKVKTSQGDLKSRFHPHHGMETRFPTIPLDEALNISLDEALSMAYCETRHYGGELKRPPHTMSRQYTNEVNSSYQKWRSEALNYMKIYLEITGKQHHGWNQCNGLSEW